MIIAVVDVIMPDQTVAIVVDVIVANVAATIAPVASDAPSEIETG